MKKLYVGNLSSRTNDEALREAFAPYGVVSAKVIMDKFSGQSRGFGFVEIETDEAGDKAIQDMNGSDVDGRALKVNEARPQESRGGSGGGNRFGGNRSGGFGSNRREGFGGRSNRY